MPAPSGPFPTAQLPFPAADSERDVVIFDGDCQFCRQQVRRLAWFDRGGRLAFVSLHDGFVQKHYPDLTRDMLMDQMYVVNTAGDRFGGADAIRYLSRRIPLLWPLVPVLHIPFSMPLWRWLYRQFAIRRYRWNQDSNENSCDENGACRHHLR